MGPLITSPDRDISLRVKAKQGDFVRVPAGGINFSVLRTSPDGMIYVDAPQVIRISFFEDSSRLAEITNVATTSRRELAYAGRVLDDLHSPVVLVRRNGVVSMNVRAHSKQYDIHGPAESGYVAKELHAS